MNIKIEVLSTRIIATVKANRLNIRNAPGIGTGEVIGCLLGNDKVEVIDSTFVQATEWLKIDDHQWIHGGWVKQNKEVLTKIISLNDVDKITIIHEG